MKLEGVRSREEGPGRQRKGALRLGSSWEQRTACRVDGQVVVGRKGAGVAHDPPTALLIVDWLRLDHSSSRHGKHGGISNRHGGLEAQLACRWVCRLLVGSASVSYKRVRMQ